MGKRVSIQFRTGDETSVVLFSHWGGRGFVAYAQQYARDLVKEVGPSERMPLDRLEPNTVMVDFLRQLTRDSGKPRIRASFYLGVIEDGGDNGNHGHHVIDLGKLRAQATNGMNFGRTPSDQREDKVAIRGPR